MGRDQKKSNQIGPVPPKDPSNALDDLFESAKSEDLGKVEDGANRGPFVDMLNDAAGVDRGSSWCATFVRYRVKKTSAKWNVKVIAFLSPSVMEGFNLNKAKIHQKPAKGDICYMQHGSSGLGHEGIVGNINPDGTHENIEGNTSSSDPSERNGGMVAIHTRQPGGKYGDLHVVGYVTPLEG